jgi:glutamate formiminotransferase
MRVLATPQWSFGRNRLLLARFREALESRPVTIHACESDADHNRTTTALSGEIGAVLEAIWSIAELAFDAIDLNRHTGVHPRLGALDVLPLVGLSDQGIVATEADLRPYVDEFAERLARTFQLPIFLFERSERGRPEHELIRLRRGGFGSLLGQTLRPDFGPGQVHPSLGITFIGVRDHQISANLNLSHDDGRACRSIADKVRMFRREGDVRFLGVRALGLILDSVELTQVALSLTLPDLTHVDPIAEFVTYEASCMGAVLHSAQLVGAIREQDVANAQRLRIRPEQILMEVKAA